MKVIALVFVCLLDVVSGGNAPTFTVGINGGQHGNLGGLEPAVHWKTSATAFDVDFDGGLTAVVKDADARPVVSFWGSIKRSIKGIDLSARADLADIDTNNIGVDIRAVGEPGSLQILATAGESYSVAKVQVKKAFDVKGGTLNVNPRFNVEKSNGELTVGYSLSDTSVTVDASGSKQKLSVGRKIGENTVLTPTVSLQGDVSVAIKQSLSDSGTLTATITPTESINVKWEDGPWLANINAPMDGYLLEGGVDVSVKRKVDVF